MARRVSYRENLNLQRFGYDSILLVGLTIKTNRMLWGRAASRCALPECRRELVIDAVDTDDPSLVGEAAHIVAEEPNGPRGNATLPIEQRNKYENLILLCNVHHKQIDDQTTYFTVDRLKTMKADHERWVRERLSGFDPDRQADDERWAAYIDEWAAKADLDDWLNQTYLLLEAQPAVSVEFFREIGSLREWLLSRVWPDRYPRLRSALENFRLVLSDFVNVFERHAARVPEEGGLLRTDKIYHISRWDPPLYELLSKRFEYHVDLVQDLTFELTRAANYVCDMVREHLDRTFRVSQGLLLVRTGMDIEMKEYTLRLEYQPPERVEQPYSGLAQFLHERASRDFHKGVGEDPTCGEVRPPSD